MTRIGLLSDTHGYLDKRVLEHFAQVDEIWHAGDIGSMEVLQKLRHFRFLLSEPEETWASQNETEKISREAASCNCILCRTLLE